MAEMDYERAAADRLEAVYLGVDVVAQRQFTLQKLSLKPDEHVLDIGSGPGFLAQSMAELVGPDGAVHGVDLSAEMIRRSVDRNAHNWVTYSQADATDLSVADQSYDVVVSTQVAEYVPDISAFCAEAFRVLRPGGRGLIMATDWNTIAWHTDNSDRMQKVMDAFKSHCANSILPRTLAPVLRDAGFEIIAVSSYPIVNIGWDAGNYSCSSIPFIVGYIKTQISLPAAELDAWAAELKQLADDGRYYYATNRMIFEFRRPA